MYKEQLPNIIILIRLFFTALFSLAIQAQERHPLPIFVNQQDSLIYVLEKQQIIIYDTDLIPKDSVRLNPPPPDYPKNNLFFLNNKTLLTSKLSGEVYEIQKDTTLRIDFSNDQKNQTHAAEFVYKDTLFRYGGRGLWRVNNFFTFFDFTTKKWQYHQTKGYSFPPEAFEGIWTLHNNKFYYLGGKSIDRHTGKTANTLNNELWEFDMISRRWKNLGVVSYIPKTSVRQMGEGKVFVLDSQNQLSLILDLPNNQATQYSSNGIDTALISASSSVILGHTLYHTDNTEALQSIALEKELLINPLKSDRIYFNSAQLFEYLTFLFFVLIIVIIGVVWALTYRKRKRPTLVGSAIRFRGQFYVLSDDEYQLIQLLNQNKMLSNDRIMEAFFKKELSYSHNNKRKVDAIDALNQLFLNLIQKKLIRTKKSETDKRMRYYYMQQGLLY